MMIQLKRIEMNYYGFNEDSKELHLLEDFEMFDDGNRTFFLFLFIGLPDLYYYSYPTSAVEQWEKIERHKRPRIEMCVMKRLVPEHKDSFVTLDHTAKVIVKRLITIEGR